MFTTAAVAHTHKNEIEQFFKVFPLLKLTLHFFIFCRCWYCMGMLCMFIFTRQKLLFESNSFYYLYAGFSFRQDRSNRNKKNINKRNEKTENITNLEKYTVTCVHFCVAIFFSFSFSPLSVGLFLRLTNWK